MDRSNVETRPGFNRHARRLENDKPESKGKRIRKVGYDPSDPLNDQFDPHELVKAYNSGDRID